MPYDLAIVGPSRRRSGAKARQIALASVFSLSVQSLLVCVLLLDLRGAGSAPPMQANAVAVDMMIVARPAAGNRATETDGGVANPAGSGEEAAVATGGRGVDLAGDGKGDATPGRDAIQARAGTPDNLRLDLGDLLAAPDGGGGGFALNSYQRQLERHISRFRHYPAAAASRGSEGLVVVRFRVGRSGSVEEAWVVRRSSDPSLDDAAIDAVWRAAPMPPVPAGMPAPAEIEAPMPFRLHR
jgi:TonB family protein